MFPSSSTRAPLTAAPEASVKLSTIVTSPTRGGCGETECARVRLTDGSLRCLQPCTSASQTQRAIKELRLRRTRSRSHRGRGLAVQRARIFDGPGATIFDSFEVLPTDPTRPVASADLERKLHAVLSAPLDMIRPARRTQPRHLRHFRIVPQVGFEETAAGRTAMGLVCTDRPGLLADIAQVLRAQRLRVHDARIATFGEKVEDIFLLTDERDRALGEQALAALRAAIVAGVDGEH